jgi:hypothetical protein
MTDALATWIVITRGLAIFLTWKRAIASSTALISETAPSAFLYLLIPKHKFVVAVKTDLKSQKK